MQNRNDFAFEFQKQLMPMVAEDVLSSQAAHMITQMVAETLSQYAQAMADQLEEKYRSWEEVMEADDTSLYTLGLRHARDLLLEQDTNERAKTLATQYEKELERNNEKDN